MVSLISRSTASRVLCLAHGEKHDMPGDVLGMSADPLERADGQYDVDDMADTAGILHEESRQAAQAGFELVVQLGIHAQDFKRLLQIQVVECLQALFQHAIDEGRHGVDVAQDLAVGWTAVVVIDVNRQPRDLACLVTDAFQVAHGLRDRDHLPQVLDAS